MDETNRCMNCKFFEWMSGDSGNCRRFPPDRLYEGRKGNDPDDWRVPHVWDSEWCGEFQLDPAALAENIRTLEEEGGSQ